MKIFSLVLLFAHASLFAAINPIQAFMPGLYLGNGSYLRANNTSGSLASLMNLSAHGFRITQVRDGGLNVYQTSLNIDIYGFVTATFVDSTDRNHPRVYQGFGNCEASICQLSALLIDGVLNKVMIFDADNQKIQSYGAIYYHNAPHVQWEETFYNLGLPSLINNHREKTYRCKYCFSANFLGKHIRCLMYPL